MRNSNSAWRTATIIMVTVRMTKLPLQIRMIGIVTVWCIPYTEQQQHVMDPYRQLLWPEHWLVPLHSGIHPHVLQVEIDGHIKRISWQATALKLWSYLGRPCCSNPTRSHYLRCTSVLSQPCSHRSICSHCSTSLKHSPVSKPASADF